MKLSLPDMTCQLKKTVCFPKKNFSTNEVITDKDGNMYYPVEVQVPNGKDAEELKITIKAKENPIADMNALDMVTFTGVQISFGYFTDRQTTGADGRHPRKKYCTLSAEKVKRA